MRIVAAKGTGTRVSLVPGGVSRHPCFSGGAGCRGEGCRMNGSVRAGATSRETAAQADAGQFHKPEANVGWYGRKSRRRKAGRLLAVNQQLTINRYHLLCPGGDRPVKRERISCPSR